MKRPYQQIEPEQDGPVTVVRIRRRRIDEPEVHALGDELTNLVERDGSRWLVLDLGPGMLECLYSVFLAKLVMLQRCVHEHGGALILCGAAPEVEAVFEACKLKDYFQFAPDREAARAALRAKASP
jgi:anti-anti-sigma factor